MLLLKNSCGKGWKVSSGIQKSKERVTIFAYSNAFGNLKLKMMVIGKSKKPRAFKNVRIQSLPMYYKN